LIAAIAKVVRLTLGDSLPAIRLLPALAGSAKVLLSALMAREMGGRNFAQALAAFAALLAPGFLVMDNLLTMNAFEPLFWMGCAWILMRIIRTGNHRLWLWFGVLAGIGLENKHSMLIFGFALIAGLLLTPDRKILRTGWLWIGGAVAVAIFLPNLVWNVQHHFPFLELQENIRRSGRNVAMSPLKFFSEEILAMLPLSAPIWIAGVWRLWRSPYRALAWAWAIAAALIAAANPRVYYLFPAFPLLFAAGGVAFEEWLARPRLRWLRLAYPALMAALGALIAPTVVPLLPPETYIAYAKATRLEQPRVENHKLGPLPQLFADQFGWDEMAAAVARAYHALPRDVQPKTAIFAQNYGQAGAIDLFGPKYGLPKAISGHQSYFLWGPRGYTGESVIVMGDRREVLEGKFASVQWVGRAEHPYSMPYQQIDMYYCRGIKAPLPEIWPKVKNWN
jgi:4-amino-4-deoxy-L-arabinose transferase-like glycosyltransferase